MNPSTISAGAERNRRWLERTRLRARMARPTRINLMQSLHAAGKPVPVCLAAKVCPVFIYILGGREMNDAATVYKTTMDPIVLKMKGGTKTTVTGHNTRRPHVTVKFEVSATMDGLAATVQFELSAANTEVLERALARARSFAEDGDQQADTR